VVAAGGGASLTDFLGLASTTAALLAAGYGAWRWSAGVWKRTVGSRKTVRRQLDGMACGVTLAYVENRLGHPAFRRPCFDLVELTWRLPHAWFCGLVSDDSLVSFAVTVTDPRFGYDCRHLTFGNLPVTLGRDTLAAGPEPGKTTVSVGARRFYALTSTTSGTQVRTSTTCSPTTIKASGVLSRIRSPPTRRRLRPCLTRRRRPGCGLARRLTR